MPTNAFSIEPLKIKLLTGEQKATTEVLADFSDYLLAGMGSRYAFMTPVWVHSGSFSQHQNL